jgi:hypothetical protein
MKSTWLPVIAALVVALGGPARASAADLSVAGGGYISGNPSTTGGAVLLSSAASVPTLPIELQATLLVPITSQGGYAVTGEVRGLSGGGFGGAYVGAGIGVGNLSLDRTTGTVLTAFVGKPIAPFTTFELRVYKGTQTNGTTAGFLGVRFTF